MLLTVALDLVGFGIVIPLLSFYSESYGATPLQVTCLMASYSLAQFVFGPFWGRLSDRVGRRPVLLASVAGTTLALAGFAAAESLPALFLFRIVGGACAANVGTANAYVADVTDDSNRARGMGLVGAAFGLGFTLGPWLGGELSQFGLAAPIWCAAGLSMINWVWVLFGLPESLPAARREKVSETSSGVGWKVLRHPVVGPALLLILLATIAFSMMESTFALVGEHIWGRNAREVGHLFAWMGLLGIGIQGGLLGRLVARLGERRLVVVGYLVSVVALGVLATISGGPGVWIGCTLMAFGMSLSGPSLRSIISRSVSDSSQGEVLALSQALGSLARAVAPGIAGLIYVGWYPGGAMAVGAGLIAVAAVIAARLTDPAERVESASSR